MRMILRPTPFTPATMTVEHLIAELEASSVDTFGLSDRIEELMKSGMTAAAKLDLTRAIATSCETNKDFRQDLIDFEVFPLLLGPDVEWSLVTPLVGSCRDMKLILAELGIVDKLADVFASSLPAPSEEILSAVSTVSSGCSDNKLKFIRKIDLLQKIIDSLALTVDFSLLATLVSVIADDDREARIPASVFAREQLVDTCMLDQVRHVLRTHRIAAKSSEEAAQLLALVRELSVSQTHTQQFALEDGFLEYAVSLLRHQPSRRLQHSVAKYIRHVSFSDDMKLAVFDLLVAEMLIVQTWLESAKSDRTMSSSLFGSFANICLKSESLASQLSEKYPRILSLAMHVLESGSAHEKIQCLQFLRALSKSAGETVKSFEDILRDLHASSEDKTVKRITDEILNRISTTTVI